MIDIGYYIVEPSSNTLKYQTGKAAVEIPINIYVNKEHFATLFSTPLMIKELVIGYLLAEGIIKSINELTEVKIRNSEAYVTTNVDLSLRLKAAKMVKIVETACGSIEDFYRLLDRIDKPMVKSNYTINVKELISMIKELNKNSKIFNQCGAVHSAALFYMGKLVAFAEDVGRHNATDKVIGASALNNIDFSKCVLIGTGRQPASMVLKVARVGIPILISIRGPIHSGVFAAQKTGITYITFNRGDLRIYSYPERISLKPT